MRKVLLLVTAAVCLFLIGVFILNMQLWYSSSTEILGGARYAAKNMDNILDEAFQATRTAMHIAEKKCDLEGQYQLGTEAALRPHLRTLIIIRQGKLWCTSLPGNRILLKQIPVIADTNLLLTPARNTENEIPVLLYQTRFQTNHIIVTISGVHIRGALNVPLKGVTYSLLVGDEVLGLLGDVKTVTASSQMSCQVNSAKYPFSIIYNEPPLFSAKRLVTQGSGILVFILLISFAAAYVIDKYLNKNDTPEETLRRAIVKGEIVPFYQPIVNGREGTLRGVEVLARWKHPKAGYISPASFIPVAEKSGLIVPLTQSLMRQVAANMNAIASKLPSGFHVGINFSASHITTPTFVEECLKCKDSFSRHDLNLVIEVTEREPLHIDEELVQRLNILHENGFVIALDDFGTGYSGLSYLHDLHIDYIKIDQSLWEGLMSIPIQPEFWIVFSIWRASCL